MINGLIDTISKLSTAEKHELLQFIENSLVLVDSDKAVKIKNEIIEARFSHKIVCPHCKTQNFVRNGHHNGEQRYQCKECGKNFGNLTNASIHSTKKPFEKWIKYAQFMLDGLSIRKCAKNLEINIKTAFRWRHKILFAIKNNLKPQKVDGIVEADETFFAESFKGNHKFEGFTMPRPPRKHGSKASKRGISDQQVCVVCGVDRNGGIISDMVCNGRVDSVKLHRFFVGRIAKDSTLVTDSHHSYRPIAQTLSISIRQIPEGKHVIDGIYHIQHVNSYHSRLKKWMRKFNGVATKYLPNYLYWFKWLELAKGTIEERSRKLTIESNNRLSGKLLWNDFKKITPQYI